MNLWNFIVVQKYMILSVNSREIYAKLLELMGKERNEACSDEERKKLGSLFYHFSSIYHANAAARNEGEVLSAGDAFLIYLGIFFL